MAGEEAGARQAGGPRHAQGDAAGSSPSSPPVLLQGGQVTRLLDRVTIRSRDYWVT